MFYNLKTIIKSLLIFNNPYLYFKTFYKYYTVDMSTLLLPTSQHPIKARKERAIIK